MNILFFTEISPFPINGGERIRSYGLLRALSDLNYKVTAVVQNRDCVDLNLYALKNVDIIEYESLKLNFIDKVFSSYFFLKDKNVLSVFLDLQKKKKIDVVILDYYLAGRYVKFFKNKNIRVIIGTHNAEAYLIKQKPSKNLLHYFRNLQHYFWMFLHERFFYKHADSLITVSKEDTDYHAKFYRRENIYMIPNFLDEKRYELSLEREDYFVMTANFGAYMNFEGLRWFILNVWNDEIDCKLFLVGKKSIESLKELKKVKNFKNIEAIGSVDDITPYIAKAKAVIVPLLHGSGSRLKCLEAMALKTPIIGTSKGVEGIKSKNILRIDEVQEFRKKLIEFKYSPKIGLGLYEEFIDNYSLRANTVKIERVIDETINVF